ncbi:alpha/beta fold hydrolase [Amnibacterium endophyticum]|uniref:Alpha/beta fold hydrolase n=1 Tax=Amnibacterium endophyticum TaxID=2109337 RepID=A0ABW4LEV3_9MICO
MEHDDATLPSPADGLALAVHTWRPAGDPHGAVQIAHGVAEFAERYDRLATELTRAGWLVVAHDHRGHGGSIGGDVPLGSFGPGGWAALVGDVSAVSRHVADAHPGLPLVLLGHSMGSFAAQQVLLQHSAEYAAAVLTGTSAVDVFAASAAEQDGGLTALNAGFEERTGYEWLSRDAAEVDEYVRDPRSGFDLADDVMPQMLSTAERLADPAALAGIRPDLPVLLMSGTDDPLAGGGDLVRLVAQRYRDAGLTDVEVDLYPGARHEVFNETNREDVTADLLGWLDAKVPVAR